MTICCSYKIEPGFLTGNKKLEPGIVRISKNTVLKGSDSRLWANTVVISSPSINHIKMLVTLIATFSEQN